ncbi:hypothetical protein LINPERPRIM_LOCUS19002 [Linum perenne]
MDSEAKLAALLGVLENHRSPSVQVSPPTFDRSYEEYSGDYGNSGSWSMQDPCYSDRQDQSCYYEEPESYGSTHQISHSTIEKLNEIITATADNASCIASHKASIKRISEGMDLIISKLKEENDDALGSQQEISNHLNQASQPDKQTSSVEELFSSLTKVIQTRFDALETTTNARFDKLEAYVRKKKEVLEDGLHKQKRAIEYLSSKVKELSDGLWDLEFKLTVKTVEQQCKELQEAEEAYQQIKKELPFYPSSDDEEIKAVSASTSPNVNSILSSDEMTTDDSEPIKTTKRKRLSRRKRKRRRQELMMVEQANKKEELPRLDNPIKIHASPTGVIPFTHPQWGSIQVQFPDHLYLKSGDDMNCKELLGWDGDC